MALPRRALVLAGCAAPWVRVGAQVPLRVVYPAPESSLDRRFDDMVDLLREALTRTQARHGPFELRPHTEFLTQPRQLLELEQGQSLSVQWSATTLDKERRLLPVRFPTRRGLLGFRLCLINRHRQQEFRRVRTLDELRRYSLGQGGTWVDTEILRSQGFRVETGHYEGLFKMLAAGRFDLFPRGINEVFAEQAARQAEWPDLVVEDSLALHYPMPYYFFFNKRNAALAARVEEGLRLMLRDGSFEHHFWTHHGAALRQARLGERRLLRLQNPLLPPETPLHQVPLWFDPERKPSL
ncbi:hypothetical protein HNQ51_000352 [Inhella inkyongensis]|uniref:Solute-binding protein family 3/N-terminal domain-containing protein n=1 Tax=Inhella inkyongensis TaxID=392593 RepID=A0A840S3E9_9BURK|nr:amino acid ABC transporter substrate-binding protein [Inhella inkyongensis]MBB5203059.1 hypothetical protein [Inhella inkyongensis]